jgi:hypothetical protein
MGYRQNLARKGVKYKISPFFARFAADAHIGGINQDFTGQLIAGRAVFYCQRSGMQIAVR